jgi:vitamin B12 transporter
MNFRKRAAAGLVAPVLIVSSLHGLADEPELDPMVVTASPVGTTLADSLQSVSVISRAQIEAAPAATLADLLAMVAGVDIRRRGAAGVQADIGIRGTAYEQTLVLVNGVPLRDPQTGHHDLNLPVPREQIERIEVVRGPGGIAYGGNATGGLVNIITREPVGTEYGVDVRGGSFSTREIRAHAGRGAAHSGHLLSASTHVSDGHLPDSRSDSDLRQAMYSGHAHFEGGSLRWGLGAEDKAFGAWKFYTADFPDQREETTSRLAYVAGQTDIGGWDVSPRVFWRGHEDWFRTLVAGTAYINEHETDVRGVQLQSQRVFGSGTFAFGAGVVRERIESNALDDHRRSESSLWATHRQALGERASFEAGLNAIRFGDYGSELLPSLGFGYRFSPHWRGFVSSARSARAPSWTEQFLLTGGNVGSPELEPERSTYHEAGLRFIDGEYRLSAALFERRTDELIDWAREPGEVTWVADNFDGHRTRGGEIEWRWQPGNLDAVQYLAASWTTLSTRLDKQGQEIKYALDYPRQAFAASGLFDLGAGIELALNARRVERASSHRATLLAARLQRQFDALRVFVEGSNLLDEQVIEAGFAPLPGRAVLFGLGWRG